MINITPSIQITKIYLVTNCFEDPHKVYIGKTKNCRKNRHKKTYGNNITYDYIDEINSLDSKDWKPLECFWIEYFRQLGFDIQNLNKKGGGGPNYYSEESKLKMSKSRIGITLSQETKDKISKSNIGKIYSNKSKLQMSISGMGKIVKQETKDKISKANKGKPKPDFFGEILSIKRKGTKRTKEDIEKAVKKLKKSVTQIDINGNIINQFDSIKEASIYNKISKASVSACLSNKIPYTSKNKITFIYTKI